MHDEQPRPKRPLSITIIGRVLMVVYGFLLLIFAIGMSQAEMRAGMAQSPVPVWLQQALVFSAIVVPIVCGAAMLRGQNWARYFYIIWGLMVTAERFLVRSGDPIQLSGLITLLFVGYWLFRPAANQYFRPAPLESQPNHDEPA